MNGTKGTIRQEMHRRRRSLSPVHVAATGERVHDLVESWLVYRRASVVLLYVARDNEVATDGLLELAHAQRKRVFLPCVAGGEIVFAEHRPGDPMPLGAFGIPEPTGDVLRSDEPSEVVTFVPLLAWDRSGGRLGRGRGFYDRALSVAPAWRRVGLGYVFQEVANVPGDAWDQRLEYVVTEQGVVKCGAGSEETLVRKEDAKPNELGSDRSIGSRAGRSVGSVSGADASPPSSR